MAKYSLVTSLLLDSGDYERGLKKVDSETKAFIGGVEKLGNGAKMLAGLAGGFLAVGSAVEVAKKFINATSDGADAFEKKMVEAEFATDTFFNTIANGDFSNLIENLRNAVTIGGKYADILDEIEDRKRGMTVLESNYEVDISKLKEVYADKNNSKDVRLDALNQIRQKEIELGNLRESIAQEALDAEYKNMTANNTLTQEKIDNYYKLYNTQLRLDADRYNQLSNSLYNNKAGYSQGDIERMQAEYAQNGLKNLGNNQFATIWDEMVQLQKKSNEEIAEGKIGLVDYADWMHQINNHISGGDKTINKFIDANKELGRVKVENQSRLNDLTKKGSSLELGIAENEEKINDKLQDEINKRGQLIALYGAEDDFSSKESQNHFFDSIYDNKIDKSSFTNLEKDEILNTDPWAQTLDYANKIENAIGVINSEPITVTVDTTSIDETGNKIKEFWKNIGDSFNAIVNEGIVDLTSDLASGIGNAMAGGGKVNFKKILLSNIATIAEQLGKLAIGVGVAVLGIQESLESLNPYVAIAAGVALIALSAYAKHRMQKMGEKKYATGGIVGGYSYSGDNVLARVNSGEMILNQAQQSRLFAIANGGNISAAGIGGEVNFKIEGANLVGVLSNYNKRINSRR